MRMVPSFDIFKIDPRGRVLWRGAVQSFVAAKARIQKLAMASPGEYLILDQNTGHRVLLVSTQADSAEDGLASAEA